MYYLQVEGDFASAHQLREYKGKCENLHGHNWLVRVRVRGERLNPLGMLMDFGDLKKLLRDTLEELDHKFLNETAPFDRINPTSENLAMHLCERLDVKMPEGVRIHEVTVWESEKCAATYQPG
ncbi:MAG: 6-carboxytetrahydropterin synthase QueD [Planctomycetaceae bacterium]|nr:6-carboxytetrahydropterin synthase QueD [Planctomycetaceae bacterium]